MRKRVHEQNENTSRKVEIIQKNNKKKVMTLKNIIAEVNSSIAS